MNGKLLMILLVCFMLCYVPECSGKKLPCKHPLPHIHCGSGRGRQDCPQGYTCIIDPADLFAVCCPNVSLVGS